MDKLLDILHFIIPAAWLFAAAASIFEWYTPELRNVAFLACFAMFWITLDWRRERKER